MANGARALVPLLLAGALSAGTGGCSGAPRIEITGQRATISPSFVGVCSIFMKIANPGDGDDALVGASVDVAGTVTEIHDVHDGRMVRSERVRVPARGAIDLGPGGLHIMVFELPREISVGSELRLRLVFERSGEKVTSVKVGG
jgi:copper(I)-binding protein